MKNGRICNKCQVWKDETHFGKQKGGLNGLYSVCHECKKEYRNSRKEQIKQFHALRYINNKEDILNKNKNWRMNNSEKRKACNKKWRQNNKGKVNKRKNEQYHKWKQDPIYNMQIRLRNRLRAALRAKQWRKNNRFGSIIGCSPEQLKQHLESQFKEGMNWENRNLWHIDHIIPLSRAKTIQELEKLSHYTNLQPLWAQDNIDKRDT